ncbi:putative mucin/carbohydrate-binding domain-containing protein, partial [Clostridium tarantellae]
MKSKKIIALVVAASLINSVSNLGVLVNATEKAVKNINIQTQKEKSNIENNIINICGYIEKKVDFKIGFNDTKKEFKVYDQTSNMLHKDFGDNKFWSIRIFDSVGNEKKYIELKGIDYANSEKLNDLNGFKYEYGDYIELWHKESMLFKQSIDGNIIDVFDKYNVKLPINDLVRFKITKEGLKVIPTSKNLDNTVICIKGDWWKKYNEFIINFDRRENKIKLTNRANWYSYKSIGYGNYCTIQIFRKNVGEVFKAELNGYDTGQSDKLNGLHNFKYEYGDVIKIWHKDFNHQIIKGHVIDATKNYNFYRNESLSDYKLNNLGFQINENGLKEVNNNAPVVMGPDYIDLNIGDSLSLEELKKRYVASDDLDGDISSTIKFYLKDWNFINTIDSEKILQKKTINTSVPATCKIEFKAIDSWGKEGSHLTTVRVISKLEKNNINILGYNSEKKFNIGFDERTKKIKVENQKNEAIHDYETVIDKDYFSIKILDKNNNEKAYVKLIGGDFGTSDKLNVLKDLSYEYGDVLILYHREKGRLTIDGEIINSKEDYADGVNDEENLNNTVFKITQNGLEAIYNEAPIIQGIEDIILTKESHENLANKLFQINLKNKEVIRAIDEVEGDITKKLNIEGEFDLETPGEYIIKYSVSDSWGRTTEKLRKITIIEPNKIEENFIRVDGFGNWGERDKFKIGFEDINKTIKVYDQKSDEIHNLFNNYFNISIFNKMGKEKKSVTISGKDRGNSDKINEINGFQYEYGDLIKLWHAEPNKLHIKGEVIDATKDYSNENTGVSRNDLVLEITKDGLKEVQIGVPAISGAEEITIRKGQQINLIEGVTASDEREGNISEKITVRNNNLDINTVGEYVVEYIVSNSLGKENRVNRKIKVIEVPKLEKNKINILGYNSEKKFNIGFDEVTKKINVENQKNEAIHDYKTIID